MHKWENHISWWIRGWLMRECNPCDDTKIRCSLTFWCESKWVKSFSFLWTNLPMKEIKRKHSNESFENTKIIQLTNREANQRRCTCSYRPRYRNITQRRVPQMCHTEQNSLNSFNQFVRLLIISWRFFLLKIETMEILTFKCEEWGIFKWKSKLKWFIWYHKNMETMIVPSTNQILNSRVFIYEDSHLMNT